MVDAQDKQGERETDEDGQIDLERLAAALHAFNETSSALASMYAGEMAVPVLSGLRHF